jgi:hypothetical protein
MKHKHVRSAALLVLASTPTIALSTGTRDDAKGLIRQADGAFDGYTLFAPLRSANTYLIDMQGRVVHMWKGDYAPGHAVYLLDNGHLLKCARANERGAFHGGGIGGLIREFDWDGNLVWEFDYSDENRCQHHDIEPLPNGNVFILAWEKKSAAEAVAAGRDPQTLGAGELWPDHIVEVKPEGQRGGRIVWEWHVWDHLIQDFDPTKENYGIVREHPERIDLNFGRESSGMDPQELRRLRALGYVGGSPERPPRGQRGDRGGRGGPRGRGGHADWNHTNSIAYNPHLDQIVLSVLQFNEIWVIDHSTTTEEAAGRTGGRSGRGGDLLYRWGNLRAHRAGTEADQKLFAQHDARWIPKGSPGAGHVLILNNGRGRLDGLYTSVDQIALPLRDDRTYEARSAGSYLPAGPIWTYSSRPQTDFFAGHISGAQRLPNGNTLICSGEEGRLFEVNPDGVTVWEYLSPFGGDIGPRPGMRRPPAPRRASAGSFVGPGREPRPPRADRRRGEPPGRRPLGPPPRRRGGGPPHHRDEANAIFRATRLAPDHPGLIGRDLSREIESSQSPPSTATRPADRPRPEPSRS